MGPYSGGHLNEGVLLYSDRSEGNSNKMKDDTKYGQKTVETNVVD